MNENVFRLLFACLLVPGVTVGFVHRWKASRTAEKLDRSQEGFAMLLSLRLLGLAAWVTLIAYLIDPEWLAWGRVDLPAWVRVLGFAIGLVSVAWLVWVFRTLGANITDTVVTRDNHALVTGGPYRYVRHPFYAGGFHLMLAIALVTANWLLALLYVAIGVLLTIRTDKEEEKLVERFGDGYREYMSRTPRFRPRLVREG